jgi:hypothetical protein
MGDSTPESIAMAIPSDGNPNLVEEAASDVGSEVKHQNKPIPEVGSRVEGCDAKDEYCSKGIRFSRFVINKRKTLII